MTIQPFPVMGKIDTQTRADRQASPRMRLLVIEDSPTIRAIVQIHLSRLGYQVVAFADGLPALHWLAEQPEAALPVLILLDIGLPSLDGYEIASLLQREPRSAHLPLVILSSRDRVTDRLKARVLGAQAYLTKPFAVQHLIEVVQTLLAAQGSRASPGCREAPAAPGKGNRWDETANERSTRKRGRD